MKDNRISDQTAKIYLTALSNWSKKKAQEGQPPWALFRYYQLSETTDIIIKSMNSIKRSNCPILKKENLQQSVQHQETSLRLVGGKDYQDNAQHHQDTIPVNLPM